ncbi:MAG TPA: hypothetical protein VGE94_04570, partial [Chloroflexota bacterium]
MRRLFVRLPVLLALLLVSSAPGAGAQPADPNGLQFVADNATTAATAADSAPLSPATLSGPDGSPTSKAVNLPAGFSIAQVASGLRSPRFMTFDDAGNLLVADAGAGNVYRYAASGGAVAASDQPPPPLLSGLEAPSNVVLHNGYLYVGETRTISRYAYDPNAAPGSREAIVS